MYLTAKKEKTLKRIMNYVVFMGPAVLLFVVIGLIPFFYEIWYSFTNWDGIHANSYEQKYYFNQDFKSLPQSIRDELQIMCVMYTEDVGGVLTMEFDERGNLEFRVTSEETDYLFDEIGSVLKIKQYQEEKKEMLEALELYYRTFFLGEDIDIEDDGED